MSEKIDVNQVDAPSESVTYPTTTVPIKNASLMVWGTRDRLRDKWASPGTLHSAYFSATEQGEVASELVGIAMAIAMPGTPTTFVERMASASLVLYAKCGRALDAHMREHDRYSRNNHRAPDIFDELADLAIMLITTLGQDFDTRMIESFSSKYEHKLIFSIHDVLAQAMLAALMAAQGGQNHRTHVQIKLEPLGLSWQGEVVGALHLIVQYFNAHDRLFATTVAARLTRIERKHS